MKNVRWTEKKIKECTDVSALKSLSSKINDGIPFTHKDKIRRRERTEIIEARINELEADQAMLEIAEQDHEYSLMVQGGPRIHE